MKFDAVDSAKYSFSFNDKRYEFDMKDGECMKIVSFILAVHTHQKHIEDSALFRSLFRDELDKITIVKMYPIERF